MQADTQNEIREQIYTEAEKAEQETRRHIRIEKREAEAMMEAAGMLDHAAGRIEYLERRLEVETAKTSTLALVEKLLSAGVGGQMCCDSRTPFNVAAPERAVSLRDLAQGKIKAIAVAQQQMEAEHALARGLQRAEPDLREDAEESDG